MERELLALLLELAAGLEDAPKRPVRGAYTNLEVLAVLLWAAVNDRPVSWAVDPRSWPLCQWRRALPSGSTVSRRARSSAITGMIDALIVALGDGGSRTLIIDGRSLAVAWHSADRDAGYGRGRGVKTRGYKLHEIVDSHGNCRCYRVEPLNVAEQTVARDLIDSLPVGEADVLLADANYDSNELYRRADARGIQMLAERRHPDADGVGHRRQHPSRLEAIALLETEPRRLGSRRLIEGVFGTQGNVVGGLGPLPNHVRGLARVRRWVGLKLAIDAAHRRRRKAA